MWAVSSAEGETSCVVVSVGRIRGEVGGVLCRGFHSLGREGEASRAVSSREGEVLASDNCEDAHHDVCCNDVCVFVLFPFLQDVCGIRVMTDLGVGQSVARGSGTWAV